MPCPNCPCKSGSRASQSVDTAATSSGSQDAQRTWPDTNPTVLKAAPRISFYKRTLPTPSCTDFSSDEGKEIFQEAMQLGHMNGFFKLMAQFTTQAEPAFCGLTSLCMVMNALEIDPKRTWKGVWRWYSETMLDCCKPLDDIVKEGVTLKQAACLASCNAANVDMFHHGTFTYDEFRSAVCSATRSESEHLIVSYTRRTFMQTGDGHFSPIGGYHPTKELVLILDTARFKYPPHWVKLRMLFDAMEPPDSMTGLPRGYLRLASRSRPSSILFTLSVHGDWLPAQSFVLTEARRSVLLLLEKCDSVERIVHNLVAQMPLHSVSELFQARAVKEGCNSHVPLIQINVLTELRQLPLFSSVQRAVLAVNTAPDDTARPDQLTASKTPAASSLVDTNGDGLVDNDGGDDAVDTKEMAELLCVPRSETRGGGTCVQDKLITEKCTALLLLMGKELPDTLDELIEKGSARNGDVGQRSDHEGASLFVELFRAWSVRNGTTLERDLEVLHDQLHALQVLDPDCMNRSHIGDMGYECLFCAGK